MTPAVPDVRAEAAVLGRYLLGTAPAPAAIDLYERAVSSAGLALAAPDARLLAFATAHPWALGLVDSGLGLLRPSSPVRRRLLVMLAILETQPCHADAFLPRTGGITRRLAAVAAGARAVVQALAGALVVKLLA